MFVSKGVRFCGDFVRSEGSMSKKKLGNTDTVGHCNLHLTK